MNTMGERITATRERAGLTPSALAREIGVTQSAVAQWETNETKPGLPNLLKFVDATGGSLDYILRGIEEPSTIQRFDPKEHAPLVNKVEAGRWGNVVTPFALPANPQYVELHRKPHGVAIALEIDGYSMSPEFEPPDIIVIDTGAEPQPGDLVVAVVNGDADATFKRYRPRGVGEDNEPIIELAPINADYPTLVISGSHPGRIIGTLMQHIRFPRRR